MQLGPNKNAKFRGIVTGRGSGLYTALRTQSARKMKKFERLADWLFIAAMTLMVAICAFTAYAISIPSPTK